MGSARAELETPQTLASRAQPHAHVPLGAVPTAPSAKEGDRWMAAHLLLLSLAAPAHVSHVSTHYLLSVLILQVAHRDKAMPQGPRKGLCFP